MCLACYAEPLKTLASSLTALKTGLESASVMFSEAPQVSLQVRDN